MTNVLNITQLSVNDYVRERERERERGRIIDTTHTHTLHAAAAGGMSSLCIFL